MFILYEVVRILETNSSAKNFLENEIDITFLDPANYFQFFQGKKLRDRFSRSFFLFRAKVLQRQALSSSILC